MLLTTRANNKTSGVVRRSLLLLTLLVTLADAQVAAPMGVCFPDGAHNRHVEDFCRRDTVPDCAHAPDKDPSLLECYMRCEDKVDENEREYECAEYEGMKCYTGLTCVLPPVLLSMDGIAALGNPDILWETKDHQEEGSQLRGGHRKE